MLTAVQVLYSANSLNSDGHTVSLAYGRFLGLPEKYSLPI
jgi:hypothetical protein